MCNILIRVMIIMKTSVLVGMRIIMVVVEVVVMVVEEVIMIMISIDDDLEIRNCMIVRE